MLGFTIHDLGDVAILECDGRITAEYADDVRKAVFGPGREPLSQLVLDLKDIGDIDAAGLGALVTLRIWMLARGTELKLMNLRPRVERVLDLTALRPHFAICSAVDMLGLLCRAHHHSHQELKQAVGF